MVRIAFEEKKKNQFELSYQPVGEISSAKERVQDKTRKTMAVCEGVTGDYCCNMLDIIFTPIPTNLSSLLRSAIYSQRLHYYLGPGRSAGKSNKYSALRKSESKRRQL